MQIQKFIRELVSIKPIWILETNPKEEIYSFKPFPATEALQANMIYIGRLSKLVPIQNDEILNFLCIDDLKGDYDISKLKAEICNCNLLIIPIPIHFRSVCDLASEIFLTEIKYTSYINQMLLASYTNKGLTYLINEAYSIIKSPIIIIDTSYKILAMYSGMKIDSRPDLETQRELGYLTDQTIELMKQDKIYEKIRSTKYPLYEKTQGEQYGWLNTLVYINGIEVAQIGMMEVNYPFTTYDFEFLHFFSQLVSWEMQKNDFYKNNRGMMHSIFLSDLLDGKIPNHRIVKLRMEQLQWINAPFLYVFTIFNNDIGDFNQKAQILAYQIQNILPYTRYVIYDTKLVFLLFQTEEDTTLFNEGGPIDECLSTNHLAGILSNCFSDLLKIRKYYDQTVKIFEMRQIIAEHKHIYFYSDYMFYHIGQIISEKYNLQDFHHPAITKIIKYDKDNKTNFIATLREHLLNFDNPTLCAKRLFIHKNTFFYRMNKMKELFLLDLSNGDERLKLHLTLEFLKLEESMGIK